MASIFDKSMAIRRRAQARQQKIALVLQRETLMSATKAPPADDAEGAWYWDERRYIDTRIAELDAVIAETRRVSEEQYT